MYEELYKPYAQRAPDSQYSGILRSTRDNGIRVVSRQDPNDRNKDAFTSPRSLSMFFLIENGAPVIKDRSIKSFFRKPINEKFAFVNGVRTLKRLEENGCKGFWDAWATEAKCSKRGLETGDLGPGSYGAAFHDFPMPDGGTFNQYQALIDQIKTNPELRTHFISPWIPFYNFRTETLQQKVVVSPCHGWVKVKIFNKNMLLQMVQRSGDLPVGVPSNMVQYFAVLLALAHATGYKPWAYEHIILEPHIFADQLENVEEMLGREARPLGTLVINNESVAKDFFSLRGGDFTLSDYDDAHPAIPGIPVAT